MTNPQAGVTEDVTAELKRLLDLFLNCFGEPDHDIHEKTLRRFLWDNKVGICLALSGPAADRGQIVEAATAYAEVEALGAKASMGPFQFHLRADDDATITDASGDPLRKIDAKYLTALENFICRYGDVVRAALSPAPAQTEE